MIENRKAYRVPFRTKFVFSCGEHVYTGNSVNISSGGIFITLLESSEIPRESICQCIFALHPDEELVRVQGAVKRVVATDPNPEIIPGIALNFVESGQKDLDRLREFMGQIRQNFELAATILASGEPDLASLEPLINKMHLPQTSDLGELRLLIERILRSIELVDSNVSRSTPAAPPSL